MIQHDHTQIFKTEASFNFYIFYFNLELNEHLLK